MGKATQTNHKMIYLCFVDVIPLSPRMDNKYAQVATCHICLVYFHRKRKQWLTSNNGCTLLLLCMIISIYNSNVMYLSRRVLHRGAIYTIYGGRDARWLYLFSSIHMWGTLTPTTIMIPKNQYMYIYIKSKNIIGACFFIHISFISNDDIIHIAYTNMLCCR